MKRLIGAALLFFALAGDVRAGFDKCKWGMTLAQVAKLYPGGHSGETFGQGSYAVVAPVAGVPALLTFLFNSHDGLRSVTAVFPRQGSDFHPSSDTYAPLDNQDGARVRELVLQELQSKYGPPALHGEGAATPVGWATKDGDLVVLRTSQDDPEHVTVSISFSKT